MTAARQQTKPAVRRIRRRLAVVLTAGNISLFAVCLSGFGAAFGAAFVAVVTDPQTGIAISGFDPVAYFTSARAERGRPGIEYNLGGIIWRFNSEANRAVFADNPEVYAPQFAGYDPAAIARGASVAGHPEYFVVVHERLYLFYSRAARDAFAAEPERVIEAAERKWPAVRRTLP